jgi:DNA-binding CsgD family transcriptional regulator
MTRLVGRDEELDRLLADTSIRSPSADRHSVVLGGDAGVGKTRLLTEFAGRAESEGWLVVVGHCLDFDSAVAYLPWSEIVGRVTRVQPDLVAEVARAHPALGGLQPGRRMTGGPGGGGRDDTSRTELFDAVHALVEQAAAQRPVLLIIEDLHWADHSTRDLFTFLVSRGFGSSVAIVGSYRSDDLHRRHPLRRQLAEWTRLPQIRRLQLGPLSIAQARQLVGLLEHAAIDPDDEAAILARAEGNPFYLEELVNAHRAGGGALPENLADLLRLRLERLDDDSQAIVRIASTAGSRIDDQLLAAIAAVDATTLDRALRDAVEHNVLVRAPDGSFAFRHALLAEAASDELLPSERVSLHRAWMRVLCERPGSGAAAEVARHARLAGEHACALDASLTAGEEASAVGGPEEAAAHYLAALELLQVTPLPDHVDLGRLVSRTAAQLTAAGHPGRAVRVVRSQLDALPPDAADLTRGQMLAALADALGLLDTEEALSPITTQALELIPAHAGDARARALASHALALARDGDLDRAHDAASGAVELADRLELPRLASAARTTLSLLHGASRGGDVAAALADAARRAHDAGAGITEVRALYLLGVVRSNAGDLPAAAEGYATATAAAAAQAAPWSPYAAEARWQSAVLRFITGEWDDCLAATDVSSLAPPPAAAVPFAALRARLLTERGEPDAREMLQALRDHWSTDGFVAIMAASAELRAAEYAQDPDGALRIYDEVVRCVSRTWTPTFAARVRLAALTLAAVASSATQSTTAERQGLAERVDELLADVRAVRDQQQRAEGAWGPEGQAWVAVAEAEALRWRWLAGVDRLDRDQLIEAWEAARSAHERYGDPFETARAQCRMAEVLRLVGGPPAESDALAAASRHTATRLGARPLLELLGDDAEVRSAAPQQLTRRELEVLRLVAAGRTNGEIGAQLFIATKTVSVHVSNILAKLNAASRTEAAAVARRDGLLG